VGLVAAWRFILAARARFKPMVRAATLHRRKVVLHCNGMLLALFLPAQKTLI
jgi:hypothetical protein